MSGVDRVPLWCSIPLQQLNIALRDIVVGLLSAPMPVQSGLELWMPRYAVIVIDDGRSPPIDDSLPRHFTPMNLRLRRQANAGPAAARNLGAQLAQGSLLAFTDDDCEPEQDWLTQLVAGINQHPQGLIGGRTLNGLRENCFSVASQVLIDYLYAQGLKGRMMNPFFASNNIALAR